MSGKEKTRKHHHKHHHKKSLRGKQAKPEKQEPDLQAEISSDDNNTEDNHNVKKNKKVEQSSPKEKQIQKEKDDDDDDAQSKSASDDDSSSQKQKNKQKEIKKKKDKTDSEGQTDSDDEPKTKKKSDHKSDDEEEESNDEKPSTKKKPKKDKDNRKSVTNELSESTTASRPKLDRYGLIITEEVHLSEDERLLRRAESAKELERESKWIAMIAKPESWKIYYKSKRNVLDRRIMKGIPDCFRSLAWRYLLDPKSQSIVEFDKRSSIQSYVEKGRAECCNIIEVDLPRTMPQMEMFSKANSIDSLRAILHAYSNYDSDLGYTQGMAFYAAMLLCYMEEKHAFWCFQRMMMGKDHLLRNFFLPEFPSLTKITTVWEHVLNQRYRKIGRRFEKLGVQSIMYAPSWFMCNFLNSSFPMVLKLRIFDCYLGFGTRAIFSFAITIIKMHEKALMQMGMESIVPLLQRPAESPAMKDWRLVIKVWQADFLTKKQYQDLFTKLKMEYIP